MRTKPLAENGAARLEEIREALGMNMSDFSLAIGYKTNGGYSATLKGNITQQIVLAAEGLLALRGQKPNGATKTFLLEIDHEGNTTTKPVKPSEMTLNGKRFLVLDVP
jgi:hypothetical protein